MPYYEVIITVGDPEDAVVVSGLHELLRARDFLDAAAQQGEIPGVESVAAGDEVEVPGELLVRLLEALDHPSNWVDLTRSYPVYLSEV